jgi:hypothetical protein
MPNILTLMIWVLLPIRFPGLIAVPGLPSIAGGGVRLNRPVSNDPWTFREALGRAKKKAGPAGSPAPVGGGKKRKAYSIDVPSALDVSLYD